MDNNVYITKSQKKKGIVAMIFGIIGGALLIFAPFMNFATLHFNVGYNENFAFLVAAAMGDDPTDYVGMEDEGITIDYGLDMFELRKMGANYSEFRIMSQEEIEASSMLNREIEDALTYIIDFEAMGIEINSEVFDELFGIFYLSEVGYAALCIVPFVLLGAGALIILFAAKRWNVAQLIFSIIATAAGVWLITCSDRFMVIVGIGGIVMIAGLAICLVSSICGIATKK